MLCPYVVIAFAHPLLSEHLSERQPERESRRNACELLERNARLDVDHIPEETTRGRPFQVAPRSVALLRHVHDRRDVLGRDAGLHYIRTKDEAEVDFALSDEGELTHLVECKESDTRPHRALCRFAGEHPSATALQVVRHLRQEELRPPIRIVDAAIWLSELEG